MVSIRNTQTFNRKEFCISKYKTYLSKHESTILNVACYTNAKIIITKQNKIQVKILCSSVTIKIPLHNSFHCFPSPGSENDSMLREFKSIGHFSPTNGLIEPNIIL